MTPSAHQVVGQMLGRSSPLVTTVTLRSTVNGVKRIERTHHVAESKAAALFVRAEISDGLCAVEVQRATMPVVVLEHQHGVPRAGHPNRTRLVRRHSLEVSQVAGNRLTRTLAVLVMKNRNAHSRLHSPFEIN